MSSLAVPAALPATSSTPSVERVADFLALCAEIRAKVETRKAEASPVQQDIEPILPTLLSASPVKAERHNPRPKTKKAHVSQHASFQMQQLTEVVQ